MLLQLRERSESSWLQERLACLIFDQVAEFANETILLLRSFGDLDLGHLETTTPIPSWRPSDQGSVYMMIHVLCDHLLPFGVILESHSCSHD